MAKETELTLIPTRCTPLCLDKRPPFHVVIHSSDGARLPAVSKHTKSEKKRIPEKDDRPELDMKRVRYEVMKFGRSDLEGHEREEADVELAVSLGARPPKKGCINYKELLQKKKEMKEATQVQNHAPVMLKTKLKKGKEKKGKISEKRKEKGVLESYGKPTSRKVSKNIPKGKRRK